MEAILVIGISGVTCGGKTTLANELKKVIPGSIIISQDDYCHDLKDPRHIWCKEVNHINFDIITGLDMDRMLEDIKTVIGNRKLLNMDDLKNKMSISNIPSDFSKLSINDKLKNKGVILIILDGFLLFAHKPLLPLIHLKYFFTLEREECLNRRIDRVYDPPDIPGYFDKCVWPEYLKHLDEVKATVDDITYLDSSIKKPLDIVLQNILNAIT